MKFLRHLFSSTKKNFTTELQWIEFPPNNFCLTGLIDQMKIAQATGDYQKGGHFRLVKIDVSEEYRSKGYGSIMIEQLISEANQKNCSHFLFVGVSVTNMRAANLYRSKFNATAQDIPNCEDKKDYVRKL